MDQGPPAGPWSLLATKNERRIVGVTLGKLHCPGRLGKENVGIAVRLQHAIARCGKESA